MASTDIPTLSSSEQYHNSRHLATTTILRHVSRYRPRTRRAKVFWIAFAFFLFLFYLSPPRTSVERVVSSQDGPIFSYSYWTEYPSYHPLPKRPEDASVVPSVKPSGKNVTVPSSLQKTNPSFHVLVPARRKSAGLCRTVTSSMILNYPPPTLVGYGRNLTDGSTGYDYMVDRINSTYNYLKYSKNVRDQDFVLIVDGMNTFFQLPPEVTVARYQSILRDNNRMLQKKYGFAAMEDRVKDGGQQEVVPKYMQTVLFGASKECIPNSNVTAEITCLPLPESSLPPDNYGWDTDTHAEKRFNRPRWLNPNVVIGQAADLKLIYAEVLRFVERHRNHRGDALTLTRLYGQQEYVRELERRRSSNRVKEWLYTQIGIRDATNLSFVELPLKRGKRYEYGVGLDYESSIFFSMRLSERDVEWFEYDNVTKSSNVQMQHGVPRESRLLLPTDLNEDKIDGPFANPKPNLGQTVNPPYNAKFDALPNPRLNGWGSVPLMTNAHSATVPAIVNLNGKKSLRDTWWSDMWYSPWARALLRKYIRSSQSHATSHSASMGGQDWWDTRGGTGGVWTDNEEWIEFADLCSGYERDLFSDELGAWGHEGEEDEGAGLSGGSEKPVYNQWGRLVKGKEKEQEG